MEKKVMQLRPEHEVPNHLNKPISTLERYFFEPCHRIARGIKSLLRAFTGFVKWFFLISGLVAWALGLYFGYSYFNGYFELMIVKDSEVQRYAKSQDKPKVEGKKVK